MSAHTGATGTAEHSTHADTLPMAEESLNPDGEYRSRLTVVLIVGTLILANLAITFFPSWTVLTAVISLIVLLLIGKRSGYSRHDIGMVATRKSIIWAAVIGVTVWTGWLLIAWIAVRSGFGPMLTKDSRVTSVSASGIMWSLVVVIPVGTVLLEEVGFRGMLLKEFHDLSHGKVRHPLVLSGVIVSLLFGLWHVGPAIAQANATGMTGGQTIALIAGTIAFTAASGGLFVWLRHHTKSLITPAVLHAAVNGAGLLIVWLVARGIFT